MEKSLFTQEYTVLAEMLRAAREEAGLRQADLAEQLGQSQSYVSKYESGSCRLDVIQLRHICAALGLSLTTFVRRFEKQAPLDGS